MKNQILESHPPQGDAWDNHLGHDVNAAARLHGQFRLRSGEIANEYFDKYRFEADPQLLRRVARRMLQLLPESTEIIAGLELGGVPIATAMSLASGLPVVFVRKTAKEYGTRQAIEGRQIAGRRIVLIEDVITTGGAVGEAARLVNESGGDCVAVVCAIWRGDGEPHIAALPGIPILSAMTLDDLR